MAARPRKTTTSATAEAAKTATTRAPKKAAATALPKPASASSSSAAASDPTLAPDAKVIGRIKRQDLLDAITERLPLKRSEAKFAMDVVLEELGAALEANDEVVVPPLGKIMVKKSDTKTNGARILTTKIRRPAPKPLETATAPLAEPGEDG